MTYITLADLKAEPNYQLFSCYEDLPDAFRSNILAGDEEPDHLTPFRRGKAWAYEYLAQTQPATAPLLLAGSDFYLVVKDLSLDPDKYHRYHRCLVQEVNGQIIVLFRSFEGSNPDDPGYGARLERRKQYLRQRWGAGHPKSVPEQRQLSLPEGLRLAYYYHIRGMKLPNSPGFGIGGRILPADISSWDPIDSYLKGLRLAKKYLPVIEEMIPGVKPTDKGMPYINFMMFLNSWDSFPRKKRTEGDHLFVKNNNLTQDGVVYYIRDGDVANMMILADPVEAVDHYCQHVLLRTPERFDFRPWAIPFESPALPATIVGSDT